MGNSHNPTSTNGPGSDRLTWQGPPLIVPGFIPTIWLSYPSLTTTYCTRIWQSNHLTWHWPQLFVPGSDNLSIRPVLLSLTTNNCTKIWLALVANDYTKIWQSDLALTTNNCTRIWQSDLSLTTTNFPPKLYVSQVTDSTGPGGKCLQIFSSNRVTELAKFVQRESIREVVIEM